MRFVLTYLDLWVPRMLPATNMSFGSASIGRTYVVQQEPLVGRRSWFDGSGKKGKTLIRREVGQFVFVPLISPDTHLLCELEISMLRPEPPGKIITQGGDIDNRIKTLFDALRMPKENEIPKSVEIGSDEAPYFFCLLEDDALISRVAVQTDRLLVPEENASIVHLDIQVRSQATQTLVKNQITFATYLLGD